MISDIDKIGFSPTAVATGPMMLGIILPFVCVVGCAMSKTVLAGATG